MPELAKISLIGLGEVGSIFAEELQALGAEGIRAYDPLFADPQSRPSRHAARLGVETCASAAEAAGEADLVISAVTAAQAGRAAEAAALGIDQGAYFLDLNSASPGTKAAAGQAIEAKGGRYVEAAVMSPVPGKGLKAPMLLGGPHAKAFLEFAEPLELNARFCSERIGQASATKMCRSVMIKGTEALLAECLLAARHYGVEEAVVSSLGDLLPDPDWRKKAVYMISRSLVHGRRRAEEMREVARTVKEAGLEPWMAEATVERQEWAAAVAQAMAPGAVDELEFERFLNGIRKALLAEAAL
jgi:3-hydroxyisobutyrate dehydrogenase-like beta-hydroxyacid dehydrogenase